MLLKGGPQLQKSLLLTNARKPLELVMLARRRTFFSISTKLRKHRVFRTCIKLCSRRKTRCTGTLPCKRCAGLALPCNYDLPHMRGQLSSPLPATSCAIDHYSCSTSSGSQSHLSSNQQGQIGSEMAFERDNSWSSLGPKTRYVAPKRENLTCSRASISGPHQASRFCSVPEAA